MLPVLFVLFWVSLIVGTLLAHSLIANWAVALAFLYFTARWWAGRHRGARRSTTAAQPAPLTSRAAPPQQGNAAANTSANGRARSRWTVDRVHSAERPWR